MKLNHLFQDLQPFVGGDGHGGPLGEDGDVPMTLIGGENQIHVNSAAGGPHHRHHIVYNSDGSGKLFQETISDIISQPFNL